jgi:hypothetical protein
MTQFDAKRLLSLSAATVVTALSLGVGSAPGLCADIAGQHARCTTN